MKCAKCEETMVELKYGDDISVMRCQGCGGLFAHRDTIALMKAENLTDSVLDFGDTKVGQKFNQIRNIQCPKCATQMDKIRDRQQVHITLEYCNQCGGIWLDAGEFTDLKHHTAMDHVKDLLARLKLGR